MQKISPRVFKVTALILLGLIAAPLQAAEQALLWRVENQQGASSYLFGTIHSEDPRVLDLPAQVEQALKGADTLVLEMELTPEAQAEMAKAIMLPAAQKLSDFVPADLYRESVSAMAERGYPKELTEKLRPWAVLLTLSMPQPKTGQFLDKVLYDRAKAEGKAVKGLETVDEQVSVFRELSLEDQQALLRQALKEYPKLPQMMERLTNAWLQRDMDSIVSLNQESMQGLPEQLQEQFQRSVIHERNVRMMERARPLLEQGHVFIAVGALHLVGDDGLVALLREQGMTLTPLY